ncbi:hypothetical protein K490DRAFT_31605 [Saccharata proteae CBS 121410]|uniref:A to I editase domain-containing protein n=1 Tax=Saccharata proteae CBS 121410 TaxID=1314787 RepID=A0A9P4I2D2_9PEZI|nr:hypothetical protein K490DRAFT_31605 [Saccharata proteae CBS 121410]
MKCLPAAKIASANGAVLHDWHAEILAIRAFNCFLIRECNTLLDSGERSSAFLRLRDEDEKNDGENQLFAIRNDVTIHMYCSEAPCGDASMELTMSAQADSTPWSLPLSPSDANHPSEAALRGRGYFSHLGVVRLKPSRPDAPPTLSKSCTDKLALKQCTSLLNSITATLLHPRTAYLNTLVLPASQHVPTATTRAFSAMGRMAGLTSPSDLPSQWQGGYHFHPFSIVSTTREFQWSRRNGSADQKLIPCNLSAVYSPSQQETIVGGVLQGRRMGDLRGASMVSRRGLWGGGVAVLRMAAGSEGMGEMGAVEGSYRAFKEGKWLEGRKRAKEDARSVVLRGWVRNEGDEGFRLGKTA